jgi:thioredoxin 1
MLDRVIITLVIAGGLSLLWLGWQVYKSRLRRAIQPIGIAGGKPTLLYFTGDYCAACKFQQTPIVETLAAKLGGAIAVQTYNVSVHPDLADRYRVLTLPTTIVLDQQGQVRHLNYGLTPADRLEAQLL